MEDCVRKYGSVQNSPVVNKNIENFCKLLKTNKVKDSKEAFLKLPQTVQCLFLHHAWDILREKQKYSNDSYVTAFRLFKLFRGKDMKETKIYSKYSKMKAVEDAYKQARDLNSDSDSRSEASVSTARKKYDKEYQKHPEPENETDPLYVYYSSLYKEKPNSKLAVTWLTEHGVFEGEERSNLIKKYKKL
jgi:hypothetical protein